MFVYVGCAPNSCIKIKQFYKPVINPAELMIALEDYEDNWFDYETVFMDELMNFKNFKIEEIKTNEEYFT